MFFPCTTEFIVIWLKADHKILHMTLSSVVEGKKVKHDFAFQRGRSEQEETSRNSNLGLEHIHPVSSLRLI